MSKPYETEREARAAVAHITGPPGTGAWSDGNRQLLEDACRAAGVQLGAYDYWILMWLAGWEQQRCVVVVGLVTRAAAPADGGAALHRAGRAGRGGRHQAGQSGELPGL